MLKYQEIITESSAELSTLEKRHRNSVVGRRVGMLRRLKSGEARSMAVVAKQLNYSLRQCQRWFKSYQAEGLEGVLKASQQGKASHERMTAAAWQALRTAMLAGEISTAREACELVAEHGVIYTNERSLNKLFARHKIKAKTGRPQNRQTEPAAQEAFKKSSASR